MYVCISMRDTIFIFYTIMIDDGMVRPIIYSYMAVNTASPYIHLFLKINNNKKLLWFDFSFPFSFLNFSLALY